MPVTFARLRIAGFKSFAEPVSVEILPGLTGIVGPNGCGKSNVVEALRWAMGESSARSLRGAEMDDLIFAGTAARPARSLAEVTLTLEEAAGFAPPPFHDQAELQISRRIERGVGSAYRVNGRELRARDVQTLFADLASGARSSAMVSQGRVSAIVTARPEERRGILEEAAGITGLHARRHEAELKLRATEANLSRAEDLRVQLAARVHSLAGQAKQAARYREIASQLRDGEAGLLALLHARARQAVAETGAARLAGHAALADADRRLRETMAAEQAAEQRLPGPRLAEADARTLLERRRVEADGAARDGERALQDAAQADTRLARAQADHDEAALRLADAQEAQARLETEAAELAAAAAALPERHAAGSLRLNTLQTRRSEAEQAARSSAEDAASARTRSAEAARDCEAAATRLDRAAAGLAQTDAERTQHRAALPDPALLHAHETACADAARQLETATRQLEALADAHTAAARAADAAGLADAEARRRHRTATDALQAAAALAQRSTAECQALGVRLRMAEAGLVPETERRAAAEAVSAADTMLAAAAASLDAADAARTAAVSARLEAASCMLDAGRRREQLTAACSQADATLRQTAAQQEALRREQARASAAAPSPDLVAAARQALAQAEQALGETEQRLAAADAAQADAGTDAARSAAGLALARETQGRLQAEADGLAQALEHDDPAAGGTPGRSWRRLADEIAVPPGLEAALAACLSDGLEAACGPEAARAPDAAQAWLTLPALDPDHLPDEAVGLDRLLAAPAELGRLLSRAGLIEDGVDGGSLQASLRPGQCLVTRTGALWRWDGYRVAAGTPSPAALRLQQRARLGERRVRLREAETALTLAADAATEDAARQARATAAARAARAGRASAEQALTQARREDARIGRQHAEAQARLDALTSQLPRAAAGLQDAAEARDAAHAALDALADPVLLAGAHETASYRETEAVAAEAEARAARRRAEADARQARDAAAAGLARHVESETARATLAPMLDRMQHEADAAGADLAAARDALSALSPEDGAAALRHRLADLTSAAQAEQAMRERRQTAQADLAAGTAAREQVAAALLEGRSRLDALDARHALLRLEHAEADDAAQTLRAAAALLPDPEQAAAAAAAATDRLERLRDEERAALDAASLLASEQAALDARRGPLAAGLSDWRARCGAADASLAAARARLAEAQAEQALRAAAPAEAARRALALAAASEAAQAAHQGAQAELEAASRALQQAQLDRRGLEAALAAGREAALRAEAREEQAQAMLAQLLAEMSPPPAAVPDDLSDAAEAALRRRIARLGRERDEIGPVNLRAELELDQVAEQGATIAREHGEIEGAIARLRGQIGHLNREGRERLLTVLESIDRHFQSLFGRMFGGGRAHLGLVGSDDPLSAGLEIYAQPPGKKLATLSLLSGGEQALCALSLIFAVFRCNPAPVCVLDEVDAPLDDANVERFCALLEDMVRETGTRFLVVTHHQLTMTHMDRLYGVTMQERGVSRVLSVDLARAAEMAG